EQLATLAKQQKARFKLALDQKVKSDEFSLSQQFNEQLMRLQQAAQAKRAELEQQATNMVLEFQQRKLQEEFEAQQREIQRQHQEAQQRLAGELEKLLRSETQPMPNGGLGPLGGSMMLPGPGQGGLVSGPSFSLQGAPPGVVFDARPLQVYAAPPVTYAPPQMHAARVLHYVPPSAPPHLSSRSHVPPVTMVLAGSGSDIPRSLSWSVTKDHSRSQSFSMSASMPRLPATWTPQQEALAHVLNGG
ncbi:unnamed protein product, partial [Polarella glacialis]